MNHLFSYRIFSVANFGMYISKFGIYVSKFGMHVSKFATKKIRRWNINLTG